jgi:hypothetical protein
VKHFFFLAIAVVLFFSACSTKRVFEPEVVGDDWEKYGKFDKTIVDTSLNIALLDDGSVLTTDGVVKMHVREDERVVSYSNDWVITSTIDGNVTLTSSTDVSKTENFDLHKTVASASVKEDTLAVLFADNELALYSLKTKKAFFKDQGAESLALNRKIENPYFLKDLVVFSTLDGKVVIVNAKTKKKLRTVIVSAEDNFNNVIYFKMIENKIVAATGYKILTMSDKEVRAKYDIRTMIYDGSSIYVATKQGEIVSLTPDLQVIGKIKFPFAHFLGMISSQDKLYILEREGYVIVLDKNMKDYVVREADVEDGYIFVTNKAFYVNDETIVVK